LVLSSISPKRSQLLGISHQAVTDAGESSGHEGSIGHGAGAAPAALMERAQPAAPARGLPAPSLSWRRAWHLYLRRTSSLLLIREKEEGYEDDMRGPLVSERVWQ
jgi:hypothetical protein